ncbi:MAG TPA: hypothetical protein VIG54_00320, partial [Lysobacter sp.]
MTPTRTLLSLALAGALGLGAATVHAQNAAQGDAPPPDVELEQDALKPAGVPKAEDPGQAQRGPARPGEETAAAKWDVNAPHGPTKTVRFTTDEGTWLDVDVSPNGRQLAFSMMGDIYVLPIGGGKATRITSGPSWDVQPRFSPDGTQIAFTSDRGGGDNIWLMNVDGSGKRQLTKETFTLLNNPTWSPDGKYIAARKHFTTGRSLGTGEIWMYHVGGGGG